MKRAFPFLFLGFYCAPLFFLRAAEGDPLQAAHARFQHGEYEDAISAFQKLTGSKNTELEAHLGLARVYIEQGEYEKAEEACLRGVETQPADPMALTILGEVLEHVGRYQDAREKYQKAISADPNALQPRLRLGILQSRLGERADARRTLGFFVSIYRTRQNLTPTEIAMVAEACVYLDRVRDANSLFRDATRADKNLWQPFVAWGNLMLAKYNTPHARGIFEDALKINPNAAEVHLGMARLLKKDSYDKAVMAAEQALAINPNLVAAHDFLASLDIALSRYEQALERLAEPLEVNPNSLSSRALRAVAYYFMEDQSKFVQEQKALLAINPNYGELYYVLAEELARRYLFSESVDYYRKAVTLNPENWAAYSGLGTSLSRLGQETEAKQMLEKAFARDPYNKYVANLLTLFDEFPQYKSHKTDYLTVRLHEKDDPVLGRYATALADESFTELLKKYEIATDQEILLEIFPSHDDFAVRCFGIPGAQAFLGICFGNVVAMDSPRARAQGDFVWGETLWHELVHVTHLRRTANRIPRWLAEGIAVYETTLARPYWSMNMDLPFIVAFQNDRILPLKDLDSGFNRPTSPGQVTLSYFQASLLVEFIVARYGHEKVLETFPKFKSGLKTPEVVEAVFDSDVDAFDAAFRDYIKEKYRLEQVDYSYNPHEQTAPDDDVVSNLQEKLEETPNNPFTHFSLGLALKKEEDIEQAIVHLEQARSLFPGFVSGSNPYSALADIYLERGDKLKATAELRDLTARNGKDLETLMQLANLCLETKQYAHAISALRKAIYIAPFQSEIHEKLATAHLALGDLNSAIAELQTNLETEPQDMAGAHCDLADALLRAGEKTRAKQSALSALEIAPNYERAQDILLASIE